MKLLRKKTPGFTMAEMLIVITIMGVLMGFMFPKIKGLFRKLNDFKTNSTLKTWQSKVNEYYLDIGEYPSSLRDLEQRPGGRAGELWRRSYLEGSEEVPPLDGSGNEIEYHRPPEVFRDKYKKYELVSRGDESDSESEGSATEGYLHAGQ